MRCIALQLGTSCASESPTLANEMNLRGDEMNAGNEPGLGFALSYLRNIILQFALYCIINALCNIATRYELCF